MYDLSSSYLIFVPLVTVALLLFALVLVSLGRGKPPTKR